MNSGNDSALGTRAAAESQPLQGCIRMCMR